MDSRIIVHSDLGLSGQFESDISVGVATYVRALRQNWRQGTVGCKGRSDVAFSGKKPWKQKGTGRARVGMKSSPLWRKGGVIFGPMPRVRKLKVTKKTKSLVLLGTLQGLLEQKRLVALNWTFKEDKPKTAYALNLLSAAQLVGKKVCLILEPGNLLQQASFANIPALKMILFDQINVVDLIAADFVAVLSQDLDKFKEVVSKWN